MISWLIKECNQQIMNWSNYKISIIYYGTKNATNVRICLFSLFVCKPNIKKESIVAIYIDI